MTPLITALEAATEGSRELDAVIYEALGYKVKRAAGWSRGVRWRFLNDGRWQVMADYTTSLDAALTLAPEGAQIECSMSHDWAWWKIDGHEGAHRDKWLAACIAALRARGASNG